MDYDEIFDDFYTELSKNHFYRGYMINSFAMVEKQIDWYLGDYFIQNTEKIIEISEILIDRLTFEAKRTALKTILDSKSKAAGFIKTKNNSYPHAKLLNELRMLNEERIKFAHYFMVELTNDVINNDSSLRDKIFGLTEFRDELKVIWYTKESYVKIIFQATDLFMELLNLTNELKPT